MLKSQLQRVVRTLRQSIDLSTLLRSGAPCQMDMALDEALRLPCALDRLEFLAEKLVESKLVEFAGVAIVSSNHTFAMASMHGPGAEHFPFPLSGSAPAQCTGSAAGMDAVGLTIAQHSQGSWHESLSSSCQRDSTSDVHGKPNGAQEQRRPFSLFGKQQAWKLEGSGWSVTDVALSGLPWLYDCSSLSITTAIGQQHPWEARWLSHAGLQSLLSLPCEYNGRVCGVLLLGSLQRTWDHLLLTKLGHVALRMTPFAVQAVVDHAALLHSSQLRRFKSTTDIASGMLNELICLDKILTARILLQQKQQHSNAAAVEQQQHEGAAAAALPPLPSSARPHAAGSALLLRASMDQALSSMAAATVPDLLVAMARQRATAAGSTGQAAAPVLLRPLPTATSAAVAVLAASAGQQSPQAGLAPASDAAQGASRAAAAPKPSSPLQQQQQQQQQAEVAAEAGRWLDVGAFAASPASRVGSARAPGGDCISLPDDPASTSPTHTARAPSRKPPPPPPPLPFELVLTSMAAAAAGKGAAAADCPQPPCTPADLLPQPLHAAASIPAPAATQPRPSASNGDTHSAGACGRGSHGPPPSPPPTAPTRPPCPSDVSPSAAAAPGASQRGGGSVCSSRHSSQLYAPPPTSARTPGSPLMLLTLVPDTSLPLGAGTATAATAPAVGLSSSATTSLVPPPASAAAMPPEPQDMIQRLQGSAAYVAARESLDEHLQQLAAYDKRCRDALAMHGPALAPVDTLAVALTGGGSGAAGGLDLAELLRLGQVTTTPAQRKELLELVLGGGEREPAAGDDRARRSSGIGTMLNSWVASHDAPAAGPGMPGSQWAPSRVDRAALAASEFLTYMSSQQLNSFSFDTTDAAMLQQVLIQGLMSRSNVPHVASPSSLPPHSQSISGGVHCASNGHTAMVAAAMQQAQTAPPLGAATHYPQYLVAAPPLGQPHHAAGYAGAAHARQHHLAPNSRKMSFSDARSAISLGSHLGPQHDDSVHSTHELFMSSLLSTHETYHRQHHQQMTSAFFTNMLADASQAGSPGHTGTHSHLLHAGSAAAAAAATLTHLSSRNSTTQAPSSPLLYAAQQLHGSSAYAGSLHSPAQSAATNSAQPHMAQLLGSGSHRSGASGTASVSEAVLTAAAASHDPYLALAASSSLYSSLANSAAATQVGPRWGSALAAGAAGSEPGAATLSGRNAPSPPQSQSSSSTRGGAGAPTAAAPSTWLMQGAFDSILTLSGGAAHHGGATVGGGPSGSLGRLPASGTLLPSLPEEDKDAGAPAHV